MAAMGMPKDNHYVQLIWHALSKEHINLRYCIRTDVAFGRNHGEHVAYRNGLLDAYMMLTGETYEMVWEQLLIGEESHATETGDLG
jgi:hypothetical protein